jgi:hypothetical protein
METLDDKLTKLICLNGDIDSINKLIDDNPTGKFDWNWGMWNACQNGNIEIVNLMISKGADSWNIGLNYACESGNIEIVNLIISKGANDWGWGLTGACWRGHLYLVKLMISKGATEIHHTMVIARKKEYWNILHFLIHLGVDYYTRDKPYINYLLTLKLDKSVAYILENKLHLGLIFKVINYL